MLKNSADSFDLVIDPTGRTRLTPARQPPNEFLQRGENLRLATEAAVPTPVSRRTRKLRDLAILGAVAAEVSVGAALEFGSSLGQAVGDLVFGSLAVAAAAIAYKHRRRDDLPRHQPILTARERARGEQN
jgi:hypothetical protein